MEKVERDNTFDEEWAARHKDEIVRINEKAEKMRKNRRIQKIRKEFLEEQAEKMIKINYNQIQNELVEKKTDFMPILNPIVIKTSSQPYFKYRDIELVKRLG